MELLVGAPSGLFCPPGGFHLDPRERVSTAVVTRLAGPEPALAAADRSVCAEPLVPFLRQRLGQTAAIEGVAYGRRLPIGDAIVSLHPSGHHLGAASVRIEAGGETWLAACDYTRQPDPTGPPFEVVGCDVLVTEAHYGLPIFRWPPLPALASEILAWWEANRRAQAASILFCEPSGSAPRVLALLASRAEQAVLTHPAVEAACRLYRQAGVVLAATEEAAAPKRKDVRGRLVLAPPLAAREAWLRGIGPAERAFASGSMRIRGTRRRRGGARGFVLSGHADWPALLATVADTGARRVLTRGGHAEELARYLRESGTPAEVLA